MSAIWGNSENIYSLGVLPPVCKGDLRDDQEGRPVPGSCLQRSASGERPFDSEEKRQSRGCQRNSASKMRRRQSTTGRSRTLRCTSCPSCCAQLTLRRVCASLT